MSICSVSWCKRKTIAKSYCSGHYARQRKGLDMNKPFKQQKKYKTCTYPECNNKFFANKFCKMHYTRNRENRKMDKPRRNLKGESKWSDWKTSKDGYVVRVFQVREGGKQNRIHQSQHRFVWEQEHGPLLNGQNIHHKNGNRSDNRLSNLEVWDTTQPRGQRAQDKLDYALEIFERYAPKGSQWQK